jgi:hypothetical protein
MASLTSQFHATLEELIDFVRSAMMSYSVYATAVEFPPITIYPVKLEELDEVMRRPKLSEIIFTEAPPRISAPSTLRFLDENPGSMPLNIGQMGPRGLQESHLSTLDAKPTWKKIVRDLKRRTKAGARFVHDETGPGGFYRDHRYTPGAEALCKAGTPMRQFTQSPGILLFGEGRDAAPTSSSAEPTAARAPNPLRAPRTSKKRSPQ